MFFSSFMLRYDSMLVFFHKGDLISAIETLVNKNEQNQPVGLVSYRRSGAVKAPSGFQDIHDRV
jgi:hypothetical protein